MTGKRYLDDNGVCFAHDVHFCEVCFTEEMTANPQVRQKQKPIPRNLREPTEGALMSDPDYAGQSRTESMHRSFSAMRNALRSIIFFEGDCTRQDEPDRSMPCECAVCIAKAALEGEEDWRFQGRVTPRRDSRPREVAMAAAWRHYFTHSAGIANRTTRPMDAIFAAILFGSEASHNDVTERDWFVATTVVQWLATNVGQCILFDAGYELTPPTDVVEAARLDAGNVRT